MNVLLELKQSCAILVNDTNPPTDEYDSVPDPREALRKYEQAQAAKKKAKERAEAREEAKAEQQSRSTRRPRGATAETAQSSAPYKHVPKNAAADFASTAIPRRPSQSYRPESVDLEPVEPYHTRSSANARAAEEEQEDSILRIRAALESRPKTSAAACIDYSGPSNETSASTSRSQTTDYSHGKRPISTGLTSINTPGEEKRFSYSTKERVSEQILQDGASASLADATAKAWMMQELARRRNEHKAGPARPASRASVKPASESDRPRSRAGSITTSVFEGVRDYVRPRASLDSMRSTRSDSNLSRSHSRSSSIKNRDSGSGWRASLRRRGSFSSWRNNIKLQQDEANKSAQVSGVPDLNRELPALPGLDQYKEKKPKPAHIAQIMRQSKKPKDLASQSSYAPPPVVAPLSPEEEQRRQYEIRRAVEEKMRRSSKLPQDPAQLARPVTVGGSVPIVQSRDHPALKGAAPDCPRTQSQPVMRTVKDPMSSVTVLDVKDSKKPSLRKRLSRFWSASGKSGSGAPPGKMVAANWFANRPGSGVSTFSCDRWYVGSNTLVESFSSWINGLLWRLRSISHYLFPFYDFFRYRRKVPDRKGWSWLSSPSIISEFIRWKGSLRGGHGHTKLHYAELYTL